MSSLVFNSVPNPWLFALGFAVALSASLLLTPLVRDAARAGGLLDPSDGDRKIHARDVPRLGGVSLVVALALAVGALYVDDSVPRITVSPALLATAGGALLIHVLGVMDDIWPMRARYKLLWQVCIAVGVYAAGLRVNVISLPGLADLHLTVVASFVVTILWLIAVTNAFNLIDGIDGLASGSAFLALMTMFAVGIVNGQWAAAWLTLTLAGALAGFLFYNFYPASIFLGDSGSLFLGFVLAATGILSAQKSSTAVAVAVPVLILGLPMLDTTLAIMRRFLRGQAIFSPDRGHIHHRLLNKGYSARRVTVILYAVCAALGAAGFLMLTRPELVVIVLILLGLGVGLFVHQLRFHEFEELAGSLVRAATQRRHIRHSVHIREGASKIGEGPGIDAIFQSLAQTCDNVGFVRAEVRLRKWFIDHGQTMLVEESRVREEISIWTWGDSEPDESTFQVRFPIHSSRGDRIGTMNLWQEHPLKEHSASHWRAVSVYLCSVLGEQIGSTWHSSVHTLNPAPAEVRPPRRSGRTSVIHQ